MRPQRQRLDLRGAVQGVGLRPFVFHLARAGGLGGFIRNTGDGVRIEVEGLPQAIAAFRSALHSELPAPAAIHELHARALAPLGEQSFVVSASAIGAPTGFITPDLAMCGTCRREIFDPRDRRCGYAFTTCLHCGPRYSILAALPYDRERTAMAGFQMCRLCRAEYQDPASRRFHAQTIACAQCGPRLSLWDAAGRVLSRDEEALATSAAALRAGAIVALKGLGGFQLLVDAGDEQAVQRLRTRKQRARKPFAIMCSSLEQARGLAGIAAPEADLLSSAMAPIVLLPRPVAGALRSAGHGEGAVAAAVASVGPSLGVMLPYTPLHALLLARFGGVLVVTSGNLHDEPIVTDEHEALQRLGGVADLWLVHDRPVLHAVDDSVVRVMAGQAVVLRRARGYAPAPIAHARVQRPMLALGGQQKSALATGGRGSIVLGPHGGDLSSPRARSLCERNARELPQLQNLSPGVVACDAHPDYFSTRLAERIAAAAQAQGGACRQVRVQHHLAHVLACQVDNALEPPFLGIAWDGSGYGADGAIWGSEALFVGSDHYRRCAQLLPFALPGAEAAVREPRRAALGALFRLYGAQALQRCELAPVAAFDVTARRVLGAMLARCVNCPQASSVGRLFDAVAALLGLCQLGTFEGEAAMAVEAAAMRARVADDLPPLALYEQDGRWLLDWRATLDGLIESVTAARSDVEALAAGFHAALAQAMVGLAERIGTPRVLLSGGCFQNARLLQAAVAQLRAAGFTPYWHRQVPPNDGGLAVGQIAFAAHPLRQLDAGMQDLLESPASRPSAAHLPRGAREG